MHSLKTLVGIIALVIAQANPCWPEVLFESRCADLQQWQVLDLNGDGSVAIVEDPTVPEGYGPDVFLLQGGEMFLFAKGIPFSEGTVLVLWKDHDPLSMDADGVIAFQADYGEDLSEAHNLKQHRHHFWIEQDGDEGFQLKEQVDNENSKARVDRAGIGLTQDSWNRNGWIWQKLSNSDGRLRAKFWSSVVPEPEEWQIEVAHWEPRPGRAGLKLFSGKASAAYFAISNQDLTVIPPLLDMQVSPAICFSADLLRADLFINLPKALPDASLELTCRQSGAGEMVLLTENKNLPAGNSSLSFGGSKSPLKLPEALQPGPIQFKTTLRQHDGAVIHSASRTIELRSAAAMEEEFRKMRQMASDIIHSATDPQDAVVLNAHSALAHLELFQKRLKQGQATEAEKSLAYAEEALDPAVSFMHYAIEKQKLSAASFVMGETYELTITLRKLTPSVIEPLKATLVLSDDLRASTPLTVSQDIQPEAWNEGPVNLAFRFRLPQEFPAGQTTPIKLPSIREGYHRLLFSLQNGSGETVWMDSEKPVGSDYKGTHELARIYVTQNPRDLLQLDYAAHADSKSGSIQATLRNCDNKTFSGSLILRLRTSSGTKIWTGVVPARIAAGETRRIDTPVPVMNWYGDLLLSADLFHQESLETCAEKSLHLAPPHPWKVTAFRGMKVDQNGDEYLTYIHIQVEGPDIQKATGHAVIRCNDRNYAIKRLDNLPGVTLIPVHAAMGTYLVTVTLLDGKGEAATTEIPLVAHVFENREGNLFLNGEPFIVKGVNVHGMIPESPERNRHMMRFLKEIGFNMLRGDYPPVWEVDMAEEENMGWMVLAPFSVNSTDYFNKHYGPHAFAQMREVTRRFIRAYRDKPAVWLWNSCNEVTNEIEDFLVTLYPQYKQMDPAQRPVVYANLFGQDKSLGQDLMAVNYYFGIPQSATSRQPLIERSLVEARKAGLPCIFTEFNCWYGPVYSKGIEALRGIYEFGIDKGYAGGFLYLLAEDPDRHPAVIATRETLWTNPSYIAALHHAFDDAVVEHTGRSSESITLTVRNIRPYWLRKVRYHVDEGPGYSAAGQLGDIPPQSSANITLTAPPGTGDQFLSVDLQFETHQGLKSHVVKQVAVRE